jgi:hypothetical protein
VRKKSSRLDFRATHCLPRTYSPEKPRQTAETAKNTRKTYFRVIRGVDYLVHTDERVRRVMLRTRRSGKQSSPQSHRPRGRPRGTDPARLHQLPRLSQSLRAAELDGNAFDFLTTNILDRKTLSETRFSTVSFAEEKKEIRIRI